MSFVNLASAYTHAEISHERLLWAGGSDILTLSQRRHLGRSLAVCLRHMRCWNAAKSNLPGIVWRRPSGSRDGWCLVSDSRHIWAESRLMFTVYTASINMEQR